MPRRLLLPAHAVLARPSSPAFAEAMRKMLARLGDDPARKGLRITPAQAAETFRFLTGGVEKQHTGITTRTVTGILQHPEHQAALGRLLRAPY